MNMFDSSEPYLGRDFVGPPKPPSAAALAQFEHFKDAFLRSIYAALSHGTPEASMAPEPLTPTQKCFLDRARKRYMLESGLISTFLGVKPHFAAIL